MKVRRTSVFWVFFLINVLVCPAVWAQDTSQQNQTPIVNGATWQQLAPNEKVAFVWGVGQFAAVEREYAMKQGDTNILGYRFAEGIQGVPMNEIVQRVTRYYENNPDQLDKPVLRVVWETVAKPNLAMK